MTDLLERTRTEAPAPVTHAVDWLMAGLALVVGAFGVYVRFAPETWWLGEFGEGWWLGPWTAAGALMSVALWDYARHAFRRAFDTTNVRVEEGSTLMYTMAFASVVFAIWCLVVWIF